MLELRSPPTGALPLLLLLAAFPSGAAAQDDPAPAPPDPESAPAEPAPVVDTADPDETLDLEAAGGPLRLEPIVVTARKWSELLAEVPESVTVLPERFIRDSGITNVREASLYVPNMFITQFTTRRLSFPFIRGIGSGVGDPAVVTYIDGVPQFDVSSTNIALLDVDRMEFLRGPQGTLYGRNALGGVIKYETRPPGDRTRFEAAATVGNFSLLEGRFTFETPLVDDELAVRVSGLWSARHGYTTNTVTGNDVDSKDSFFGRGQVLWTPDPYNEVRFTVYGEQSDDGPFALFSLDSLRANPFEIAIDFEGESKRDIVSGAATWDHFGDGVDFTSITSYTWWDILEKTDFDFTPIDAVRRRTDEDQRSFYQEFRFGSAEDSPVKINDGATLRWLVGGSFFYSDKNRSSANDFRPGGVGIFFPPAQVGVDTSSGEFKDTGLAGFGQATLTMGQLDLSAGLRYDYELREAKTSRVFDPGGFPIPVAGDDDSESFDDLLPRFSAAYRLNRDAMVYGLAAKGFKAGGFNLTSPAGSFGFGPERSWLLEAGVKTAWFEDRLAFNAAIFYIDWSDLQLTFFDPSSGGFIANAGDATSKGFELELVARPLEGVDVFAGFGYTDATFDEGVDQFGGIVDGNHLPFVPETTLNVGAQYTGKLGASEWYARGEYIHTGTYFYDAGNRESDDFGLANFRVGFRHRNFWVEGWIRNAFDDDYVLTAFQPSPADPSFFVGENAAPRTFGVTVTLRF